MELVIKYFMSHSIFFNKQARLDNKVPLLNKSQTLECYSLPDIITSISTMMLRLIFLHIVMIKLLYI